jgi:protein SCO1
MRKTISHALALVGALTIAAACEKPYTFHGAAPDPPMKAPPLVLTRGDGTPFDLATLQGNAVLLFFGYTHCPDICPTTLADWKKVKAALGADSVRTKFVFVTVDPKRDSARVVDAYAKQFDPSFIGVTGDEARIAEQAKKFGVTAFIDGTEASMNYAMNHPSHQYLIDPKGNIRMLYLPVMGSMDHGGGLHPLDPKLLAEDIKHIF